MRVYQPAGWELTKRCPWCLALIGLLPPDISRGWFGRLHAYCMSCHKKMRVSRRELDEVRYPPVKLPSS